MSSSRELQGIAVQLVQNGGDAVQLLLAHLQNPQAQVGQLVDHRFHGGGFAGTGVAGEQDVGGGLAGEQSHGVGQDDLLLPLVVDQGGQTDFVRVVHRDDLIFSGDVEHGVSGIDAVAVLADVFTALPVGGNHIHRLRGKLRQIPVPVQPLPQLGGGQTGHRLEDFQLPGYTPGHLRGGSFPPSDEPDAGILIVSHNPLHIPGEGGGSGGVKGGHKTGVPGHGPGGFSRLQILQVFPQGGNHRVFQQIPEDGQTLQPDVQAKQFFGLHTFRIAPFAPLDTRAA